MNLKEQILRILKEETSNISILNRPLKVCSKNPITGYYRDGYCKTDTSDTGTHTVCAEVNDEFLEFTKSRGNDLTTPKNNFPGLKSGDRWCLCAKRWKQANDEGMAPQVIEKSTNIKTLDIIGDIIFNKDLLDAEITEYSRTLKNARQQGVGLRFPNSAIKSNPLRFRSYNR